MEFLYHLCPVCDKKGVCEDEDRNTIGDGSIEIIAMFYCEECDTSWNAITTYEEKTIRVANVQ